MKSDPCSICGGTDTHLVDGYYYCVECGTQDTSVMETVVERGVLQDGTYAATGKRKINTKKVEFKMSGEWYKWHAYNFILSGIADELISLGASPSFKSKLLWIWILYIKKFHNKEDYETNDLTQQQTILESGLKDSDNDDEDDENEQNDDTNKNIDSENKQRSEEIDKNDNDLKPKSLRKTNIETVTFPTLYAMVYCALNLDNSDIQAPDILRFIREGRLSYKTAVQYVPKEVDKTKIPHWHKFQCSTIRALGVQHMLIKVCSLFKELDLGSLLVPNLGTLVTRYCKELCLPKEFRQLVMSLLELMPPEGCRPIWKSSRKIPEFTTVVMAYIVVGLKMCFGLDDDYDLKLTYVVNEMNEEENYVKAYRIGLYEPTDRLFSFGEWLKYLEFRKLLLCKYYQPMSSVYKTEINNCLVAESVNNVKFELRGSGSTRRDEMTFELLKNIPQDTDFHILPKEGFPASLTPLTVYTEHVLINATIEDPRIKLLLSEDFSKYSLNYACVDLKLQFSAVTENLVKGVEEINRESGQFVKNSLKSHRTVNREHRSMAFVIDAKNDDVLGKYANIDSTNGDHIDLEMINEDPKVVEVPKVNEVNELNTIAELDAEDNIFGVNFDEIEKETQPTDSFSQEHLQVNDFQSERGEDRDETFLDLINDSEFDPQNFNREDVIRNLILRYCNKYKIPKPFEYKELSTTVRTKNSNEDANKNIEDNKKPRKPREVYTGELNSNNILKLYKTTLDKMNQEIETEIQEMYDSDGSIDNNLNIDLNTDTTIQNAELNVTNTDGIALEPIVVNTDGELVPVPTIQTPDPMDITDVLFNVSESDLFPAPIEICNEPVIRNESEVANETADFIDQELQELQDIDVNDIVLGEIKKYESVSKKGMRRKPYFTKADNLPLAELVRKERLKKRDRSHMRPLINNIEGLNLKQFNYYIIKHNKTMNSTTEKRSYSFEKEMLDNFPRSYRYILRTCATMVEVNSYELFRYVHMLEEYLVQVASSDIRDVSA